jgi:hypothetical protein
MVDVLEISQGAGSNKISLYTNLGNGSWSHERRIALPSSSFFISACIDDLNGDGHHDIIYADAQLSDANTVMWFKNSGGGGAFAEAETIVGSMSGLGPESISAGDLDGDGDKDLLVSAGDAIYGYENDGQGVFSNLGVVARGSLPRMADLTNDGKMDVLAVSEGSIVWYENHYTGRSVDDDLDNSTTTLTSGEDASSTDGSVSGTVSSVTGSSPVETTTAHLRGTSTAADASSIDGSGSSSVSSVTESRPVEIPAGATASTSPKVDTVVSSTWGPGPLISNNGQARSPAIACLVFAVFMASVAF